MKRYINVISLQEFMATLEVYDIEVNQRTAMKILHALRSNAYAVDHEHYYPILSEYICSLDQHLRTHDLTSLFRYFKGVNA
ncbi:MAG: hypothetical protein ACSW8B_02105 [bacterium]